MNKFQFIQQLINTRKFTTSQKERLITLVTAELENSTDNISDQILDDLRLIKEQLGIKESSVSFIDGSKNFTDKPKSPYDYHSAEELDQFNKLMEEYHKIPDFSFLEIELPPDDLKLTEGAVAFTDKGGGELMKKEKVKENAEEKNDKANLPKYLSPKDLTQFIYEFNQDPILKSTWHPICVNELETILTLTGKEKYDYRSHKRLLEQAYFKLSQKYKDKVNKNIRTQIGEYLNDYLKVNKGWSENNIRLTWSSKELVEWCDKNPRKCPSPKDLGYEGFVFPPITLKDSTVLNNFNDVVSYFKKQIQIRADNSLKEMTDEINFDYYEKAEFITDGIRKNIQLFTDTEKVKQAYRRIILMSIEYHNKVNKSKPKFVIDFNEKGEKVILSIHHVNTVFGKTLLNAERLGTEFSGLIKAQLNGLCDFTIEADFGSEEYGKLYYWPAKKSEKLETFKGVRFNLIFYRAK